MAKVNELEVGEVGFTVRTKGIELLIPLYTELVWVDRLRFDGFEFGPSGFNLGVRSGSNVPHFSSEVRDVWN